MVLAEDTLQPSCPLVAIKIMKRQHTYMGQKVCFTFPFRLLTLMA